MINQPLSKVISRILNSLVHRSGIMIEVNNLYLIHEFNNEIELTERNKVIESFIKQFKNMTVGIQLYLIGDLESDGSYPVSRHRDLWNSQVISIGAGNNLIFDEGMARLGANVWLYDHTVVPIIPRKLKPRIKFINTGVRATNPNLNCITLEEMVAQIEQSNESDQTIVKMDCEGIEWDVILSTPQKILSQIDQLIVEFHDLNKIVKSRYEKKYLEVLKKLEKDFVITYVASNNFSPIIQIDQTKNWAFTIEVHFLNRKALKEIDTENISLGFPSDLGFEKRNWHLNKSKNLSGWYV